MGIAGGGFYFHNMALPLMANAAEPKKNTRNILTGFICVFLTYCLAGISGVYGFSGVDYASFVPSTNLITENCLNQLPSDTLGAALIRLCTICQLVAVSTLLFEMLRYQLVLLYHGIKYGVEAGSQMPTMISRTKNLAIFLTAYTPIFMLGVYYPHAG